ncbi:MAG: hypothetical protein ACLT98_08240 [Eggerthellaceae bacterium]
MTISGSYQLPQAAARADRGAMAPAEPWLARRVELDQWATGRVMSAVSGAACAQVEVT